MKNNYHLFLLIAFFYCACVKEREIHLPPQKPIIVLNCLFNPDSTWHLQLSFTTSSLGDTILVQNIENARVELWANDTFFSLLTHTNKGSYRLQAFPKIDVIYKVKVKIDGYAQIEAVDKIPHIPSDVVGYWDLLTPVSFLDENYTPFVTQRIPITFSDYPQEVNFYQASVWYYDSCVYDYPSANCFYVNHLRDKLHLANYNGGFYDEPLREVKNKKCPYLFLSDESFQNTIKNTSLYADTFFWRGLATPDTFVYCPTAAAESQRKYVQLYVHFTSMSEPLFKYYTSYYKQAFATSDPFAIYTNVFSNVEGGLGIFGGYQTKPVLVYSD